MSKHQMLSNINQAIERRNRRKEYYKDIEKIIDKRIERVRLECSKMTCKKVIKEITYADKNERDYITRLA